MAFGILGQIIDCGLSRGHRDRQEVNEARRRVVARINSPQIPPLERLRLLLSEREKLVLGRIGNGDKTEKIAADLGRGTSTIDTQRASIGEKVRAIIPGFPITTGRLVNIAIALQLTKVRRITAPDGSRLTLKAQLKDWQFELMRLLGRGFSGKEIAVMLKIETGTVDSRREVLLKKVRPLAAEKIEGELKKVPIDLPEIVHICRHERLIPEFDLANWQR